jgi:hypothetical protein
LPIGILLGSIFLEVRIFSASAYGEKERYNQIVTGVRAAGSLRTVTTVLPVSGWRN